MSLYALQQCLFDQMRRWGAAPGTPVVTEGYELSDDERAVLDRNDIGELYRRGVHPVLLNGWCRATGHTRDDYKRLLAAHRRPSEGAPRWRTSS